MKHIRKINEINESLYENQDTANIRQNLVDSLKDLLYKIENNVPCPEKAQTIDILVEISDSVDECLHNWYY